MKKSRRRKVRAYIYIYIRIGINICATSGARTEGGRGGGVWEGVEINSLHPEDRYDTPRKYSTIPGNRYHCQLVCIPVALWRIHAAIAGKSEEAGEGGREGHTFYAIVIPYFGTMTGNS